MGLVEQCGVGTLLRLDRGLSILSEYDEPYVLVDKLRGVRNYSGLYQALSDFKEESKKSIIRMPTLEEMLAIQDIFSKVPEEISHEVRDVFSSERSQEVISRLGYDWKIENYGKGIRAGLNIALMEIYCRKEIKRFKLWRYLAESCLQSGLTPENMAGSLEHISLYLKEITERDNGAKDKSL